ncbi:aminoglycoside phosphotransferase family protein [Duganella sp. Root1480D1]|uniref:aminoglycoside phosphotransferase family protein n=1 Tax=Duganella sp. Root1480D1 TaxID=1736471 RepID=UPI00070DBDF7|nr:phosphotransferase [Duganella sp. Root1480D1]KQZ40930.1 aminoglycoside phosphotransferase [Duganella sp. Root1480D1]
MSLLSNSPSPAADPRLAELTEWLQATGLVDVASARPASEDASFRRYFRVDVLPQHRAAHGATLVAMDAPPQRENVPAYVKVQGLLQAAGVSVPKIAAESIAQGFLLLSDLGSTTYLQALNHDSAATLYAEALSSLVKIQQASQPGVLPEFDRAFMLRELNIFPEWYIGKHLATTLSEKQQQELDKVFEAILANCLAQPQVFMHRDYHSRNLMWMDEGNPGILDFQDAVWGPITYDAASLLRDAYVSWDEELVLDWLIRYWQHARSAGLPVKKDFDDFYQDFEYMALQRHLKILGIFCRLNYRDGKPHYLGDLPTVMEYVRKTANRYRELKPLIKLLDTLEGTAPQVGYTF